jgi:hypothetical protein
MHALYLANTQLMSQMQLKTGGRSAVVSTFRCGQLRASEETLVRIHASATMQCFLLHELHVGMVVFH